MAGIHMGGIVAYTLERVPDLGIVVLESTGTVTNEDSHQAVKDLAEFATDGRPVYLLTDVTGAELALTLPSTYLTAREKVQQHEFRLIQALVAREDQRDFAQFWEDTNLNSGVQAQAFTDRQAAIAWLVEQQG